MNEREEKVRGGVVTYTAFNRGGGDTECFEYERSQAEPACPSDEGSFRKGKAFGSAEI
jgi:hypothetical protein